MAAFQVPMANHRDEGGNRKEKGEVEQDGEAALEVPTTKHRGTQGGRKHESVRKN